MLNIFGWFGGQAQTGATATELYGSIVAQARDPSFYREFGVGDVAEKRYEMIVLHIVLVLERLRTEGSSGIELGRRVVEAFVRDLDGSIREMALGDTKVPANVKKAAGGLYDRDALYRQAFEDADQNGAGNSESGNSEGGGQAGDDLTLDNLISELIFDGRVTRGSRALARYATGVRSKLRDWRISHGTVKLDFPEPARFLGEL